MVAGVEDAVIATNEFVARVLADGAELVVYIGNGALDIGDRHDGMLVKGEFLVRQFFECPLSGGQTVL